ncbi:MAG: response regulator transcription factor [Cyanobacteria bacterium SZAS LIN-2]|nr:response regulator transcription factor [Cyanobacteria bacterium SZAS LIN-3]MBS1999727.1 response regulator transcription factor [Cyanobacteria bacterium SZAS LIN-2]MBS2007616.1 response regulator transcription factor [Cyanobacteria bacterium SZAS TMP-1]
MVVDDHVATRQEIVKQLTQGGLLKIVAEAETSHEAWQVASQILPDIVLLDLHLPGLYNTFDLLKRFSNLKRSKVVIFASQGKASEVQDLLDAGASGYVLKDDPPALLKMALLMVSKGSKWVISPSLPRHLTRLTAQERTILRYLTMRGKLSTAAERMGISQTELDNTVNHLVEKLELDDSDKLLRWAKKHGF